MDKLTFSIGWKSTLLTLLVVPVCISLGVWQLQRADEKAQIATIYAERAEMPAMRLDGVETYTDKTNLPVLLQGQFTGTHLLLENQWRNKKLGVEVLSLFETIEGQQVLINRGWLANKDRSIIPAFSTPTGLQQIHTTIYQPSKAPYSLGKLMLNPALATQRLMYLDVEQIAAALGIELYPLTLRLTATNSAGFDTNWPEINVKPETHTGYAVQWFLFAAIAFLVFIFANSNLGRILRKRDS